MEARKRKDKHYIKKGWLFINNNPICNVKKFLKTTTFILAFIAIEFITIICALIGLENMVGI